jgi:signal transduction histidine kinase
VDNLDILLVEDNLAEARLLQEVLKGVGWNRFHLTPVKRLREALERLQADCFDVILLDLTLPDSQGLASLDALIQSAPKLPIVVLTNTNDDELAIKAVRHGAQDYLVKRLVNQEILVRSLHYAIERKQSSEALREANEALEMRVQARTAELAEANQRLKQEIQQRQRVQERLELAQRVGKIGAFEWSIPTNEIAWTKELDTLYGLASGSFGGSFDDWMQMIHADDRHRIQRAIKSAVESGNELDVEFRICSPNHEIRWIAAKSSVFCDRAGNPVQMIGIHIDITEKKQLEAQFLRAQRLESLGTLASGIAHDLNNILTPILAIAKLLPMKIPNLNQRSQWMLETLEISAKRGADLVKQILSFARGVEGRRISLNVGHLIAEVQQIIQETFLKSIVIQTDIAADVWMVSADTTQLHQVLMNLCVNARDAMPQGGTLGLKVENLHLDETAARKHLDAHAGRYVVITVTDTGSGIPPEVIHRIFDPFFTTKAIGQGTGLGLSAVLGIVKSHGGFVDVQSTIGQGSQFQIYLPACETMMFSAAADLELLSGHQELILVVDDEATICEVTKTTLEAFNYRVLTAQDGTAAIALYAEHMHEIRGVLIDMMMPAMDGPTTIPMLRRLNPKVPVIAMSGLTSTETVAQAERLGSLGFLQKPFSQKELLQALQNLNGLAVISH